MFKNNMLVQLLKRYKFVILLVIIICVGAFFRFYQLDSVPPAPSVDEVATGYNAYSILQTGRDEYGKFLPLILRSYDDYKPALYVYLVIPFVKVLGLTVLAVRLPSAILSTLSLIAFYYLIKTIFRKYHFVEILALSSTLFLAISPWHIYISRLGFETNAALSFFIFGLLFFFRKKIFTMLLFFGLSFVAYQSEKIFIPLYTVILVGIFYKSFLPQWKRFVISSLLLTILLLPFLLATFSPGSLLRFSGTNFITANEGTIEKANFDQQLVIATQHHDIMGEILHNRRVFFANILFQSYIAHFNPYWLFTNNNNNGEFKVPGIGLLHILFLPWYLLGIIGFFILPIDKKIKSSLLLLFLIAPVPAAITTGAPHAIRAYPLVLAYEILAGFGFVFAFTTVRNKFFRATLVVILIGCTIYVISGFYKSYFHYFPKSSSQDFQYAMKMSMNYIRKHHKQYNQVIVSNRDNLYESYMFYLFYSKYSPQEYQKNGGTGSGGYAIIHKIDNITFRPVNWNKDIYLPQALLLENHVRINPKIKTTKIFYNLDKSKSTAIAVVKS